MNGCDSVWTASNLLLAWNSGDHSALAKLTPIVYAELRRIAQRQIARERGERTLQASALVNEAYLRLIDCNAVQWRNRVQFFGVTAGLMRRILVDAAPGLAAAGSGAAIGVA